jgi:hypothetical protein
MQAHPPAKSEAAPAAPAATAPTPPWPGKAEKAAATTKAGRPTTLLDVEEVEWITRELERLLAREQGGGGDDAGADGRHHHHHHHHHRRKRAKLTPAPKKGGFLADLLGKHAASICSGVGDDAVDRSSAAAGLVGRKGRRRGGWGSFREVEKV